MNLQTDVEIGDEFVGYRIDELIGQGGMGVVYRAYDLRLKRTVALKLIAPALARDELFRTRFERESELVMSLEHPNVIPIHDAGDGRGHVYLAMRLVEGSDLRALLRAEGTLEPSRAVAICAQVGAALDAAHAKGLVHRDVKPSNVLLDGGEHVYLADFGLTRRLDEPGPGAGDERAVGTPAYLAPEQIEGGLIDGRSDVYSLGCILFECLTGASPFSGRSRLEVAWAHLEHEPPSAHDLDEELPEAIDAVIRTALAKEPDDRYATCGALIQAAREALGLGSRTSRKRKLAFAASGVLAAVSIAAIVGLMATRDSTGPSAPAPLFARPDTVTRIDPTTNAVLAVIDVGAKPAVVTTSGSTVWVYNHFDPSVSEIDARTNTVRATTSLSLQPESIGLLDGPVLASDSAGAWVVAGQKGGPFLLTRIRPGGGKRDIVLDRAPRAVAVGFGSVWVVGRSRLDHQVLRIDKSTGTVTGRTRFAAGVSIDGITVGFGAVWVVGSSAGTLYRIHPRTMAVTRTVDLPGRSARPVAVDTQIWVGLLRKSGMTANIDPKSLALNLWPCCPPDWGENVFSNGSLWWYDWPSGTVLRTNGFSGPVRTIRVTSASPMGDGPCLTSIAFGAGGVWVTAGYSVDLRCSR